MAALVRFIAITKYLTRNEGEKVSFGSQFESAVYHGGVDGGEV